MKCSIDSIRAAIYARVSSDQQAEANTIASQVAALEERLGRDGLPLEKELRFLDEGSSGSTLVRPALERLRDAAAEGATDRLYVHSPDRLARSYAYQVLLVEELRRCGVELVFLNRPLGRSPEDDLLLQVQGVIAEYERAKILERSRRGKLHAAGRGSVSALAAAPYGYRYVTRLEGGGTARYDVVLEQARVVRQVFAWVGQERCSIGEVCRRLHHQGIPSPGGMARWDRKTVWAMLRNPAYKGTARFGKSRSGPYCPKLRPQRGKAELPRRPRSVTPSEGPGVAIAMPALVGEDLFAAVAGQLEENRRRSRLTRRGARYLLQGLLVCKQCGYALYGKPISPAQSRGKRRYTYYRCIGTDGYRFGGQKACSSRSIRTEVLDEAVWQDVCGLLKDPERVAVEYRRRLEGEGRRGGDRDPEALEPLIRKVRRGIARLIDAYGEGLLEKEEFEPRVRAARERLARLQAEAQEQADDATRERELRLVIGQFEEFAERVGSGLVEADWGARRGIVRALVSRVEVDGEAVRIVYRVGPCPFAEGPSRGLLQGCGRGVQLDLGVAVGLIDRLGGLAEVMHHAHQQGIGRPERGRPDHRLGRLHQPAPQCPRRVPRPGGLDPALLRTAEDQQRARRPAVPGLSRRTARDRDRGGETLETAVPVFEPEPVKIDVNEMINRRRGEARTESRDDIGKAVAWLAEWLAEGPVGSIPCTREGETALGRPWPDAKVPDEERQKAVMGRVKWWRVKVLKEKLGGSSKKLGMEGPWFFNLPGGNWPPSGEAIAAARRAEEAAGPKKPKKPKRRTVFFGYTKRDERRSSFDDLLHRSALSPSPDGSPHGEGGPLLPP